MGADVNRAVVDCQRRARLAARRERPNLRAVRRVQRERGIAGGDVQNPAIERRRGADLFAYLAPPVQRTVFERYGIDEAVVRAEEDGVFGRGGSANNRAARPEIPDVRARSRVHRVKAVVPRTDYDQPVGEYRRGVRPSIHLRLPLHAARIRVQRVHPVIVRRDERRAAGERDPAVYRFARVETPQLGAVL